MNELRERWSDPLLTTLTMLVLLFMFVVAPLRAVGIIKFQEFAFVFTLVLVGGVFTRKVSNPPTCFQGLTLVTPNVTSRPTGILRSLLEQC